MNLRDTHLSSRAVIPVALALPINRDPAREHDARAREHEFDGSPADPKQRKHAVCFYL